MNKPAPAFSHERLVVYQRSIEFVAWVGPLIEELSDRLSARDQLDRASTSVPPNIAEGNVKASHRDRARFWQFAFGSAVECAACLDVLVARKRMAPERAKEGKTILAEVVRMMAKLLDNLGTHVAEEAAVYGSSDADEDEDADAERGLTT